MAQKFSQSYIQTYVSKKKDGIVWKKVGNSDFSL